MWRDEARSLNQEIPWKEIAGMRDKVIHQYDRVKIPVVWLVVSIEIPELLANLELLLPEEY